MHPPEKRSAASDQDGFVLIGVVMFVLALTILGISLFGLSSYESQFMGRSYSDAEALLTAQSAVERAKFVIAKKRDIGLVHTLSGYPAGTYSVCAWQQGHTAPESDSTGGLIADSTILIRAAVEIHGEQRMIEAKYTPREDANIYKRLMTTHDGVDVEATNFYGDNICGHTALNGFIHETVHDPSSTLCAAPTMPYSVHYVPETVDPPQLASYRAMFHDGATPVSPNPPNDAFNLTVAGGGVGFFRTDGEDPVANHAGYSVYMSTGSPAATITVSGRAIWLVQHGFRSDQFVEVHGTAKDCLVIVSGHNYDTDKNGDYQDIGIWFFAGVHSPTVPVILVTDGQVRVEQSVNNQNGYSDVGYLSAFAQSVWLAGPKTDGLILSHDPHSPYDDGGNLIDQLCDDGYLPNSSGLGVRFSSIAGTWRELDPDNPQ